MSKTFTPAEVAKHKDDSSMWIIVEDGVYDLTCSFFRSESYHIYKR